jgi:hypothetical protein
MKNIGFRLLYVLDMCVGAEAKNFGCENSINERI